MIVQTLPELTCSLYPEFPVKLQDTIKDINGAITSNYYEKQDQKSIITSLPKVFPCQHISYLKRPGDSLGLTELNYFKGCDFTADDMERIVKLFNAVPPLLMIDYIKSQSENMQAKDAGEMYYNLMWNTNFKSLIKEVGISETYKTEIIVFLKAYRDILREDAFDRIYTEKFIDVIASLGKSLEEQMKQIIVSNSKGVKEYTTSILKDVSYNDLGIILKHFDKLPVMVFPCSKQKT